MMRYSSLQILLEDEKYDEAFDLLAQARSEGMLLDVLFFNTIIKKLCEKVNHLRSLFLLAHALLACGQG